MVDQKVIYAICLCKLVYGKVTGASTHKSPYYNFIVTKIKPAANGSLDFLLNKESAEIIMLKILIFSKCYWTWNWIFHGRML